MSLISFRNFLAPFGSRFQIGALLVLAFLAFVFRVGASTSSTSPRGAERVEARSGSQANPLASELEDIMAQQQRRAAQGTQRRVAAPADGEDAVLEGALAGDYQEPPAPPANPGARPLGDIKKSLGLE